MLHAADAAVLRKQEAFKLRGSKKGLSVWQCSTLVLAEHALQQCLPIQLKSLLERVDNNSGGTCCCCCWGKANPQEMER